MTVQLDEPLQDHPGPSGAVPIHHRTSGHAPAGVLRRLVLAIPSQHSEPDPM